MAQKVCGATIPYQTTVASQDASLPIQGSVPASGKAVSDGPGICDHATYLGNQDVSGSQFQCDFLPAVVAIWRVNQ